MATPNSPLPYNSPRSHPSQQQRIDPQQAQINHLDSKLNHLNGRFVEISDQIVAQTKAFTEMFQASQIQATTVSTPLPHSAPPPLLPPGASYPDLKLPPPPFFSGTSPMELPGWSISIMQYILSSPHTYATEANKVLCFGSFLSGPARIWYQAKCDPTTFLLPPPLYPSPTPP